MSKQLYEEAIADVKKLKEIAEDNAKRAVVEAVAPRIRELIEKELLGEAAEEVPVAPGAEPPDSGKLMTDDLPSQDGEVVVDLKQLGDQSPELSDEHALEMSEVMENIALSKVVSSLREFDAKLRYVDNMIDELSSVGGRIQETKSYEEKTSQLGEALYDLYQYATERLKSPSSRLGCTLKIQNCLKKLEKLQEIKMKKKNSLLSEETVSLELTGLPDDIDLESLGVNLVSGGDDEEEEGGEEEGGEDLDLGDEEEEGGEDLDLGDEEEEGGEEEGGEEEGDEDVEEAYMPESRSRLSDNVIVEIDENMLRNEIKRMKMLREASEAVPSTKGSKPAADEFDDFGGADEEGEPLDLVLRETDEDPSLSEVDEEGGEPTTEADSDPHESEERSNVQSTSHKDAAQTQKQSDSPANESHIRASMAHELKLQESLKLQARRAARLFEASKTAARSSKTLSERREIAAQGQGHKEAYASLAQKYNNSVKRFNRLSEALAQAKSSVSARSNNVATKPAASSGEAAQLRNKLAETNLINAKLMFTNKLLQSDALTARQKSQVIAQLDEAKTLREVKLVYESLAKTLATPRKPVTEGRVLGSSSQATRSASSQTLSEGFEAERWAKLAGISK